MFTKVYNFDIKNAFTFFKAGQFVASNAWKHKDVINQGDYEFIMVINGGIYLTIDGEEIAVKKHECIVIPPYTRHFGFKGADPESTHYWLHFFPSGPVSFTRDYRIDSADETKNYHLIQIPQHFQLPEFEKIIILCKQLLDCANEPQNSPLTANFFVTSIALELANQFKKHFLAEQQKIPTKFETILQWIRLHSHEDLTVHAIAEQFEITPAYLTRLFKKFQGLTTNQFITQAKVKQAEEMLLTTNKSIKEIALELSFSSEKYFMRVFKQQNKLTPTEFRNLYPKTYMNNHSVDPMIPRPNRMMEQ